MLLQREFITNSAEIWFLDVIGNIFIHCGNGKILKHNCNYQLNREIIANMFIFSAVDSIKV